LGVVLKTPPCKKFDMKPHMKDGIGYEGRPRFFKKCRATEEEEEEEEAYKL
jgi:hypothetical protein